MPDPINKKWAGVCMLCGSELSVALHVTRVEDAPDVFIPGANTHNCEAGRILHENGSDAYEMWLSAQSPGTHVSWDELMSDLEKFENDALPDVVTELDVRSPEAAAACDAALTRTDPSSVRV
jgi:hypothetical protein